VLLVRRFLMHLFLLAQSWADAGTGLRDVSARGQRPGAELVRATVTP
jgi:hypothetical protein